MAALPAVVLLAGCSGGSIAPGIGGNGGLGPGGTGDPDATLVFRIRGINSGDFKATEMRVTTSMLGFQIQGSQTAGNATTPITRVATIRFNGIPVQGATYVVGGQDENGAVFEYAERNDKTRVIKLWEGSSGSIHVDKVTSDHVTGTFGGNLDGTQNVTGQITASGGEFCVKYQQQD